MTAQDLARQYSNRHFKKIGTLVHRLLSAEYFGLRLSLAGRVLELLVVLPQGSGAG